MEVALDSAPLLVGCRDDARARLLYRLQLGADLGVKPRVLERESRGRCNRLDELRLVAQGWVVDENRERLPVLLESASPHASARLRVPRARARQRPRTRRVRVSRRPTSSVRSSSASASSSRSPSGERLLEMDDELADVNAGEPRRRSPPESAIGSAVSADDLPPEEVVRRGRVATSAYVRIPLSTRPQGRDDGGDEERS